MFLQLLQFIQKDLSSTITINKSTEKEPDNIIRFEILLKELLTILNFYISRPLTKKPILTEEISDLKERCFLNTQSFFKNSIYHKMLLIYSKINLQNKQKMYFSIIRQYIIKLKQIFVFLITKSNFKNYDIENIKPVINKTIFYLSIYFDLLNNFYLNKPV